MALVFLMVGFLAFVIVGSGTEDEWQGRIKKPVGLALLGTAVTWIFWWMVDPVEGGVFLLYSPLILLVMAVLTRLAGRGAAKWFWLGVLAFVSASVLLIPIVKLLERVPSWDGYDVVVTLEADTPEGPRSASGICRLRGELFDLLTRDGNRQYSFSMDSIFLDLGEGRSVTLSLRPSGGRLSLPPKGAGLKYKHSLVNGKERVRFVNAMQPVYTARNGQKTMVIRPAESAAFFGPGYSLGRMILRWPEE
ncbi:hypothetical protein [Pseudodesulfovibrio methanolicus]|uniref:DUF4131 domain-containing protein n=1 Tax=Pseudodesulfovibrio methanolicus TaxID=3126690 RepID=A0ABZ2IXZ0_9BACT